MIYKQLTDKYLLRFELGDDFFSEFSRFLKETSVDSATFSGIGSFNQCELGFFNPKQKEYSRKTFDTTHEVTSLIGNLSLLDRKPFPHVHVTISDQEFNARGGHLFSATVGATLEVPLEKFSGDIYRKFDSQIGLNLLDL